MRVGQKGTLTRIWAATGARPTALRADGYQSVDLFGAVCPARDLGCALILPRCDTAAVALFLAEPGGHVAPGAHAVVVLDGAGWHTARPGAALARQPHAAAAAGLQPGAEPAGAGLGVPAPAPPGPAPVPRPYGPPRRLPARLAPVHR
jgi:hypothetical protein